MLMREARDVMLETLVAFADESLTMSAIDAMNLALTDDGMMIDLFYALYGQEMIRADRINFRATLRELIDHAGNADDDMYND
jgi:hypothetical protein